jgi:hypothetical protein
MSPIALLLHVKTPPSLLRCGNFKRCSVSTLQGVFSAVSIEAAASATFPGYPRA